MVREYPVADFTKESGHEEASLGQQDESEDRVGGLVRTSDRRALREVTAQPESVLSVAGQVFGGIAPGLRGEGGWCGGGAFESQDAEASADNRGADGGAKKTEDESL